jgi:hypothetical protein
MLYKGIRQMLLRGVRIRYQTSNIKIGRGRDCMCPKTAKQENDIWRGARKFIQKFFP